MDLAATAVDLDERPGRQTSRCVGNIHHTRDTEFARYYRGMRHRSAELGHHRRRVGEGGGVADIGDLGDQDLSGFQVVDGVRPDDAHPAADSSTTDTDAVQGLPGGKDGRHGGGGLPTAAEHCGQHEAGQPALFRAAARDQSRSVGR